ncbi:MAG: AraC family transcriptional regulator [Mycobacterium leprae]
MTLDHVRIVNLKPMKVASYRAESASPEKDAWDVMMAWVKANGLDQLATTRYFGFDNPGPAPGRPTYGYEVWVTVPDHVQPSGPIQLKECAGGLFAVVTTYLYEIGERWASLVQWAKAEPGLAIDHRQCLEESVLPDEMHQEQTQLDLFLPIRRI